jgi:hypothetical protein
MVKTALKRFGAKRQDLKTGELPAPGAEGFLAKRGSQAVWSEATE